MKAITISFAIAVSLCSTVPAVAEQGGLNLLRQAQQMADLGITTLYTGYEKQDGAALIDYGVDVVADIRGETLTGPLYAQMADLGITTPYMGITTPYTGYEKFFDAQPINPSFDGSN